MTAYSAASPCLGAEGLDAALTRAEQTAAPTRAERMAAPTRAERTAAITTRVRKR